MKNLSDVEAACGYTFKDESLLKKALTLSSYNSDHNVNNQSLECLGDSLLSFIVAEKYYALGYTEGQITQKKQQLLSDEALRLVSQGLGLEEALLKDKGDSHNKKAIPSAYEALIAAIYLDGGLSAARAFSGRTLKPAPQSLNFIGALQEYLQGRGMPLPVYTSENIGTVRAPLFKVEVSFGGNSFYAEGENISEAKRKAAKLAYEKISEGNK